MTNKAPTVKSTKLFTITNDFQDYKGTGLGVYIALTSIKTGKVYVIPPTTYKSVALDYVITDLKVEGECSQVPEYEFPLAVSVCETTECLSTRPLNALLKNPLHYNIDGIGGLFIPQIYPSSPCSKNFIDKAKKIEQYTTL